MYEYPTSFWLNLINCCIRCKSCLYDAMLIREVSFFYSRWLFNTHTCILCGLFKITAIPSLPNFSFLPTISPYKKLHVLLFWNPLRDSHHHHHYHHYHYHHNHHHHQIRTIYWRICGWLWKKMHSWSHNWWICNEEEIMRPLHYVSFPHKVSNVIIENCEEQLCGCTHQLRAYSE